MFDPDALEIGSKVPILSPVDNASTIKCEIISKKHSDGMLLFYIHYLGLNRRYDVWVTASAFSIKNPLEIEQPKKKKKSEGEKEMQKI
ncbi:hypothetical protein ENBRE01_3525, partial [Enteropsectra breve]